MKILYKKEKGVSPVIATILMVAITVVLASAVYLMVSGYIGSAPSKPVAMSFQVQQLSTGTQFMVVSGNISTTDSVPLKIVLGGSVTGSVTIGTITLSSGSYSVPSSNIIITSPSGASLTVKINSVTGTYLAAGTTILFAYTPPSGAAAGPLPSGTTLTFVYNGATIYSTTL